MWFVTACSDGVTSRSGPAHLKANVAWKWKLDLYLEEEYKYMGYTLLLYSHKSSKSFPLPCMSTTLLFLRKLKTEILFTNSSVDNKLFNIILINTEGLRVIGLGRLQPRVPINKVQCGRHKIHYFTIVNFIQFVRTYNSTKGHPSGMEHDIIEYYLWVREEIKN